MIAVLARMASQSGAPPSRLLGEFAALSFGPGKISFSDYARLRLYDDAFWSGVDKKSVIGERRGREIAHIANHSHDREGLCANRLALNAYLAAFGFPVAGVVAIFARGQAGRAPNLLHSRCELRQFLSADAPYPLSAAPMERACGSAGTVLTGYDSASGMLLCADGRGLPIDHFIADVSEAGRYLFQKPIGAHPAVTAVCGPGTGCVRVVTLRTDQGPRLFRACWSLPCGSDRRATDLLAQLDLRTGAVLRVTRGAGPDLEEVNRHPGTGGRLIGACVPDWEALKATAVEAARAMHPLTLIGWEIAPSDAGPVILGASETPDLTLHQIAERRGLLDEPFQAFLTAQRHAAAEEAEFHKAAAA